MAKARADSPGIQSTTRRSFLKSASAAVASSACTMPRTAAAIKPASGAGERLAGPIASPVDCVNVLQGTQSTPTFSHGNTLPIAAAPFGMAHWTIQTNAGTPWFFQPWERRIQGFRCTHQLSPWLSDYGFATFLPVSGKGLSADAPARASSYLPGDAKLTPYSLELYLLRYRTRIELVPTERGCVIAANYDELPPDSTPQARGFVIDIPRVAGEVERQPASRRIQFACNQTSGGTPQGFATYYVVEFDATWESCDLEHREERNGTGGQLVSVHFSPGRRLEIRIATSFISFDQAAFNLRQEIGTDTLEQLRQRGKDAWNTMLRRLSIEGASEDQALTFYSCLYRTMLFPRTFHEPNPHGAGVQHYSCFNGKVEPGVMYADHGYWDVYRAWYPLGTILFPERIGDILQAWVNAYQEGGWFPQFPAPGYRACMSGSLIDSLFADAIVKNVGNFDRNTALAGLKKHATQTGNPEKGYGRAGVADYMRLHYVPADKIEQSVAETADAAYGDFCIAQVAKTLHNQADYQQFMQRSAYWKNVYDAQVGFFRGKNSDGSWLSPFDPFTWGSPYEEGSAWQHRWDAPHAVRDLVEAIGGEASASEALEQMMSVPPLFHVGVYGAEIHEMSEMAAVPFGQYAHSNQPSHHLLYLFAHAGRPERLQSEARRVMNELYSPLSFPGDEDTGSMSAWYILSSLGLYQVCPGLPEYTFGSPLFPRATVHLSGGKTLVVEAPANSFENVYVRSIRFNNALRSGLTITHEELMSGGTLRFEMSSQHGV